MANAGIKVTGLKQKQRALLRFKKLVRTGKKEIWTKLGDEAVSMIQKRTKRGKDKNGRSFKPYTPAYIKKKGSSNVNLTQSGKMLKSVTKQSWSKKCRIYVKALGRSKQKIDTYNLAVVHDFGTRKMPKREFMGLMKSEIKKLKALCKKLYYKEKDKIFK